MIEKAVPVVLRSVEDRLEILMFRHPLAGVQIVKGTVDPGEEPSSAALREFHEEAGISDGEIYGLIGCSTTVAPSERWHFYRCSAGGLPDRWNHHCSDGGGLDFSFFWQPLDEDPRERCDPVFTRALGFIRHAVLEGGHEDVGQP